jgi:AbrB family looped-hinge helix DNA binding protein
MVVLVVKVTSKRQVTFPKRVLEALGVGPGDQIELEERPEGFVLRPRRSAPEWVPPLKGKIPPDLPPLDLEKFREEGYDWSLRD